MEPTMISFMGSMESAVETIMGCMHIAIMSTT